ncbi:ead/Ea22-like family protein, partial [Klebsiella pneumoniae]
MTTDITELAQQELAQLRAELSNQAIGSKDHLRKIALSLVDKLEKCRDREIRWLALSDEKSKIITDQEEALEKAQRRNAELEAQNEYIRKRYQQLDLL